MTDPSPPAPDAAASVSADQAALADALQRLLAPLARLAVAQGLPYAALDEMLRRSVVREAHAAHPDLPEHRRVSRISTATGLNRREVTRLIDAAPRRLAPPQSTLTEVFTHWANHPDYQGTDGRPRVLPRTGAAPSFESLAQEVNRDVHPRSFLEELLRLGLAEHDAPADTVQLSSRLFVPRDDLRHMVGFLGANVGDHLAAAVDNVLHTGAGSKPHFEQAVFGEGLSAESVAVLREALRTHWKAMLADLSLRIEAAVAADASDPATATERVRFGLFSFHEATGSAMAPLTAPTGAAKATAARPKSGPKTAAPRAGRSRPRPTQESHDAPDVSDPSPTD